MLKTFNFGHFIPISTVDWHSRSVSVIFFRGCQLRCPYCQNHAYITGSSEMDIEDMKSRISKTKPFISAVVFSGGEPTLQKDALIELAGFARSGSLAVGLETNGFGADVVMEMLDKDLLDKVFLDVKAPLDDPEQYAIVTGLNVDAGSKAAENTAMTLDKCIRAGIGLEVRTTVFRGLVGAEEVRKISQYLDECDCGNLTYAVQQGLSDNTLDMKDTEKFSRQEVLDMATAIKAANLKDIRIRTIENGEERIV
ncbi:MAG: anaerobic ribonucleoside-triphosphate reductase activating protein [ANME-2 cluster archaeon]|nr:anaerobic ribonucleoside-triphosphate reductase activating protein [ANME-2 cluster archaeon]MBC2701371.1 anaerobic ribonucleoside-triphosphate reductase activating protein [ANME-2 cluster archaeon]MBC2708420.1 anaerobic ribonucleoside-triphosphate reductase activating protein [ANME-2 cluster archaeon]MBC2745685.1 anaerobic ribonucleoside-triphosphate reductase activating protein [ANME-2 cluster archaeon]MBC2764180.1 anaerobic ribonucleoside-triphosphate reductase activating protein [ANME-2 c